jgi:pyroglutamyl-peptidase
MALVLVSGFEPFGGSTINASGEAVKLLHGGRIDGAGMETVILPVVFGVAFDTLWPKVEALRPDLLVMAGQAETRSEICLERVALNLRDARLPDNAGAQPVDQPVVAGGPAAYFCSLDLRPILAALMAAGLPARLSETAGTFVCNDLIYRACHRAASGGFAPAMLFVHVPAEGVSQENLAKALKIIAKAGLSQVRPAVEAIS